MILGPAREEVDGIRVEVHRFSHAASPSVRRWIIALMAHAFAPEDAGAVAQAPDVAARAKEMTRGAPRGRSAPLVFAGWRRDVGADDGGPAATIQFWPAWNDRARGRRAEGRMLGWFRKLMPREDRFFDLFARHTQSVVGVAAARSSGSARRVSAVRWGIAGDIVVARVITRPAAAMIAASGHAIAGPAA